MPAMLFNLLRLARPKQWVKSAFVALGPLYGLADGKNVDWLGLAAAIAAFCLASSGCYVVNDLRDREADRNHPRKKLRPIASGLVAVSVARVYAAVLLTASLAIGLWFWANAAGWFGPSPAHVSPLQGQWLVLALVMYIINVTLYSLRFKRVVMLDVVSLATGFVFRVLGGCAAAGIEPSTWLLNTTLFVSMFLAFSKRLGERRTLGDAAASARGVQAGYTDDLLRMAVVVTAVATLVTYAGYVQARDAHFLARVVAEGAFAGGWGFNQLWLTMIPATFGLLRCIVLVERGTFDDPTELAFKDLGFKAAILGFGVLTAWAMWSAAAG